MARGKGWITDEDVSLTKAWIEISEDATTGTEQKSGEFWDAVTRKFRELCVIRMGADSKALEKANSRTTQGNY